jgi:hypothetical protein
MIEIAVHFKGARAETVKKIVQTALQEKYPGAGVTVIRKEPAESRPERYSDAQSLRDELQDWLDNLPENLRDGDKASQLEEAISQLDEFISNCEEAAGIDVDFPGMF